ncbi:transposase [Streptomyces sp. NBC_00287]|nr:transposase [Streptomyces sp. NBC_00287]
MAARLGEEGNRQALAHSITFSPWDPAHVRARLAWRMHEAIGPEALIVDNTGFLKDGDASACVSRQYTGTAGKVTNCQVGVSLHLAHERASTAVNWRLFLPASWDPASAEADAVKVAQCGRCGIPDQVGHVEKWQLALDMIDEIRSWGLDVPLVVADAGYGDAAAVRHGLEERKLPYAVGISSRHTAHPADARPVQPAHTGAGRPPRIQYPQPAQTVKELAIAAGRTAVRPVSWREGSRPGRGTSGVKRMYSRFVTLRIRPAGRGVRRATDGRRVRALAAGPMADRRERAGAVLAVEPALRDAAGHAGAAGQAPLAHRARPPRDESGPGPGPLRRAAPTRAGTTTSPSAPPPMPSAHCNDWHETQKTQRRPEPLSNRPRTTDTPGPLDRRLPHLPPRYTTPYEPDQALLVCCA